MSKLNNSLTPREATAKYSRSTAASQPHLKSKIDLRFNTEMPSNINNRVISTINRSVLKEVVSLLVAIAPW